MNNPNIQSVPVHQMDRQALRLFGGLAIFVFSIALSYCYYTNHFFEAGVIGAVMLGLSILVVSIYTTAGTKSKNKQTEPPLKQAA